ncbi:MAG: imidazole glycerol phosphate synthase subunit HisF [Saprospiraceae bacterium]|nr:imidazole glycerol phosphate synthase subunit HisF [Saprospiraceae bacterium]
MIAKRIVPCLDIKDGRTVKGTNFLDLRDAGDPIELAKRYADQGADELVFLDITATLEKRKTLVTLVEKIGRELDIPFTVGGGIRTLDLVDELLQNGADKVSINSAAIKNPNLITEISEKYGCQCLVVAVDGNKIGDEWKVFTRGGTHNTGIEMFGWVEQVVGLGAGEILFTSMNKDGTKSGFEIEALNKMSQQIQVPIIASGGAGNIEHFVQLFQNTGVTAGLAASIFHFREVDIPELKQELQLNKISIRI